MKTLRSAVLLSTLCGVAACTPMNLPDSCRIDTDCDRGLICDQELCVLPTPRDAGSKPDAGLVEQSDAGFLTEQDAGASCVPSGEACNGLDDDCDGVVDDLPALTNPSGGPLALDGGTGAADGSCVVGVGACQRSGRTSCAGGQLVCSVTGGAAVVEICNGMDDDCDGQVDEPGAELCPASGQTCGAGACSCPSGQAVCGTACVSLGAACSVGVGACARSGSNLCTSNAVACSATAGTPGTEICNSVDDDCDGQVDEAGAGLCQAQGQLCNAGVCVCPSGQSVCNGVCKVLTTEVCDGLDNDCDGQTDEGVTITCLTDSDNDRYASSSVTSQVCADASRPQAGSCPSGYVSQVASLGTDCAANDATKFQNLDVRTDADGDAFCVAAARTECVGASPATGTRLATTCQQAADDCNDADGVKFQNLVVRNDVDGDGYCGAADPFAECSGSAPNAGRMLSTICPSNIDCNDGIRAIYQQANIRRDADNDTYCSGAAESQCVGANVADVFAGYRLSITCNTTADCKDTNPNATTACVVPSFTSSTATKSCGIGIPATEQKSVTPPSCPLGFSLMLGAGFTAMSSGTCSVVTALTVSMTCGFVSTSSFSCNYVGQCSAN